MSARLHPVLYFVWTDKSIPKSELIDKFRAEKWSMWSLTQGLQQLPEALGQYLASRGNVVDIRLDTPCTEIDLARDKPTVRFANVRTNPFIEL